MTPPPAAAAPAIGPRTPAPARPRPSSPRPRRISGPAHPGAPAGPAHPGRPARPPAPAAPRRATAPREGNVVGGLLAVAGRLSTHRLLDRLIRGRGCIALVAFALIGIVTLQLGLLKLNAGIGRSLERSAVLQRENAALAIENSELASGNRVESNAAHLGMQLVAPSALRFLGVRGHSDLAPRRRCSLRVARELLSRAWCHGLDVRRVLHRVLRRRILEHGSLRGSDAHQRRSHERR